MIVKEDIEKAVKESFDVAKVTNVILDEIKKAFGKGFDLGVKVVNDAEFGAGRLKWHDLRKSPDDLPTDKHFKITSDGDIALYDLFLGKRYDLRSDELTYQLAAWCEIPTFEV